MDNVAFFRTYREFCELTDDGLLFRYPESEYAFDEFPVIKKQDIDLTDFKYIGFQNTRKRDSRNAGDKTVGFFMDDSKFEHICYRPWAYLDWLGQYKQVMSPDLSC